MDKTQVLKRVTKHLDDVFGDKNDFTQKEVDLLIAPALQAFQKHLQHTVVDGVSMADWIAVWWHVDDIEWVALSLHLGKVAARESKKGEWPADCEYDQNKMHEVLAELKWRHDATVGINWDAIEATLLAVAAKR